MGLVIIDLVIVAAMFVGFMYVPRTKPDLSIVTWIAFLFCLVGIMVSIARLVYDIMMLLPVF